MKAAAVVLQFSSLVIHTEQSFSSLKTNHHEFTQKAGAAALKEA